MKKNNFLLLLLCVSFSAFAQDLTTLHQFDGSIKEFKDYSGGVIFTGTTDSYDQVVASTDGKTYVTIDDALVLGSTSSLSAWSGSNVAFYHADNDDELGVELNKTDGSVNGTGLLIGRGQGDIVGETAVCTEVFPVVNNGDTEYYYFISSTVPGFGGEKELHLVKTDGTDNGTINIENTFELFGSDYAIYAPPYGRKIGAVVFDNKLFHTATFYSRAFMHAGITYDYINDSGENVILSTSSSTVLNPVVTDDYLFLTDYDGGGAMYQYDKTYSNMGTVGSNIVSDFVPVRCGNRIFAIQTFDLFDEFPIYDKVICFPGDAIGSTININAEAVSDNISELIVSGSDVYFVATPTGGNATVYTINTTDDEVSAPVAIDDADFAAYEITNLQAIEGGVVYTLYNETASPKTKIKVIKGDNVSEYSLKDTDVALGEITHIIENAGVCFLVESTVDGDNVLAFNLDGDPTALKKAEKSNFNTFPNPVSNYVELQADKAIVAAKVFSLSGTSVYEESGQDINKLNLTSLPKGVYLLVVTDAEGNKNTSKITKK